MIAVVAGYGNMGRNHARVLRDLGLDVITVDPDPSRGADHHQWRVPGDLACIATPPEHLVETALVAKEFGMRMLVEKPMATSPEEGRKLEGCDLRVGFTERHNPAVQALRENLHRVGKVTHLQFRRLGPPSRAPLHPALDLATHDLDVLRFLGYQPRLLSTNTGNEHCLATYDLGDGTRATLEASHTHPAKIREIRVIGTDATLTLDYQTQVLDLLTPKGTVPIEVTEEEPLVRQWRAFLEGEGADYDDGMAALGLAEQILNGQVSEWQPDESA